MPFNEMTIAQALKQINANKFVLPAIQREFVWGPGRICKLFDSLMQGFPVGSLLFWNVEAEYSGTLRFYGFMRDYHERDNRTCPELPVIHNQNVTAILDGQQRLTALNIGLQGSMSMKKPRMRWTSDNAFPATTLFFNLTDAPEGDEEGETYHFKFHEKPPEGDDVWFPVPKLLSLTKGVPMLSWLQSQGLDGEHLNRAFSRLDRLYDVLHTEKHIAYFVEERQDIDRVLQIFIRMNSGGIVLSYSDLLLSIATAQWTKRDARKEVQSLVDDMNNVGNGFRFDKDLVLKAGLMLLDVQSVGFKVENFNRSNMELLEANWDGVREALIRTVQLVSDFGFDDTNLRADSALLPIAYYVHRRGLRQTYLYAQAEHEDRERIRRWLMRSFLKPSGIWGSGLDTLLTALRSIIRQSASDGFPVAAIEAEMARRGKGLAFSDEEIEELCAIRYGDRRLFCLLTLLYDFVDTRNNFHIDHFYPRSRFTAARLRTEGVADEDLERLRSQVDEVSNLQLLEGGPNIEKAAKWPHDWLETRFGSAGDHGNSNARNAYLDRHDLVDVSPGIQDFDKLYEARRSAIQRKLIEILA